MLDIPRNEKVRSIQHLVRSLVSLIFFSLLIAACQGPPGPVGPPGPQGEAGLSGYEKVIKERIVSNWEPDHFESDSAHCPPGKRVLGGGAAVLSELPNGDHATLAMDIRTSYPTGERSWSVMVANPFPVTYQGLKFRVFAVCAKVLEQ